MAEVLSMDLGGTKLLLARVSESGEILEKKKVPVELSEGPQGLLSQIIDAAKTVRDDIFFLSHGGPISTPEDAAYINENSEAVGFVGASSLERMAVEESLVDLTREFKSIPCPAAKNAKP